jgi:LPXTG-motif cell wall-anchored protein
VLAALAALLMVVFSLGLAPAYAADSAEAPPSSGDTSQPQPLSRADQNDGGANGQCPDGAYCSTRDGSASENGVGDGEAKGKPCAGCVGKADNKNPRGQMPDGSDPNAGYECDTNQGVGQSNPAHTGCTESEPVTAPATAEQGPEAADTPEEIAPAQDGDAPAGDQPLTRPAAGSPQVLGVQASRDRAPGSGDAAPATANRAAPTLAAVDGVLPNTGAASHLGLMLGAGLLLVLAGGVALLVRARLVAGR